MPVLRAHEPVAAAPGRTSRTRPRRGAMRLLAATTVTALLAGACGSDDDDASPVETAPPTTEAPTTEAPADPFAPGVLASGATLARFDQGDVTVHTYTNPEAGFGNTTAVVETAESVVLVDAHFSERPATEFRAYAVSFGKPIERLFLTHEHPDHIGGVEPVFSDVTSASSAGVIDAASAVGTTIDQAIEPGEETIDGIRFVYDVYTDAEAAEQIVISLPDHGVVFSGDLVYNGYHAFMPPNFENWISIVQDLRAREGVELVVPGHGSPGGPEAFDDIIGYLATAAEAYAAADDADTFRAAMVEAYPDRPGVNLLEFGLGVLYPTEES